MCSAPKRRSGCFIGARDQRADPGADRRACNDIASGAILRYDGATGAYIDTEDPEAPSSDRVRIRRVRPADGADLGVVADNLLTP
jgi:hypothetical protein